MSFVKRLNESAIQNKHVKKIEKKIKRAKYNPMYWYPNRLLSYDPKHYWFYIAIGSRGRGKTTSAWRWVLKRFMKHNEKFIWLRLTDAPIKKMSRNASATLVPQFILDSVGIESLFMKGSTIYANIRYEGKMETKLIGIMDSISTYYTTKGNTMEDFDNVVFDEINRETTERNTFDITRAFINQIESIARMRKIRVLMLGNTINDTSDILSLFNFQPKEFGLYTLKRKHAVIEYMDDSEEFKKARKNSLAGVLLGGNEDVAGSFVNKTSVSRSSLVKYDSRMRQLFIFYVDTLRAFGVYELNGRDGATEGLYIGEVRQDTSSKYKISPFINCSGIYDKEIYDNFYELISVNMLYFETAIIRDRFTKALRNNRTVIG